MDVDLRHLDVTYHDSSCGRADSWGVAISKLSEYGLCTTANSAWKQAAQATGTQKVTYYVPEAVEALIALRKFVRWGLVSVTDLFRLRDFSNAPSSVLPAVNRDPVIAGSWA
jgi:hypothetical protein